MKVIETGIAGVLVLEPKVFGDARGFFMESFNRARLCDATGLDLPFVQDNHSRSRPRRAARPALPGEAAAGQAGAGGAGRVFDVAVDMRRNSPTFGKWHGVELSGENHRQFWVPAGFAHGFYVMSDSADFLYKTTDYYAPEYERSRRTHY
jgi:dTDP-4-dehydrorhamnose 3,5-epimerase